MLLTLVLAGACVRRDHSPPEPTASAESPPAAESVELLGGPDEARSVPVDALAVAAQARADASAAPAPAVIVTVSNRPIANPGDPAVEGPAIVRTTRLVGEPAPLLLGAAPAPAPAVIRTAARVDPLPPKPVRRIGAMASAAPVPSTTEAPTPTAPAAPAVSAPAPTPAPVAALPPPVEPLTPPAPRRVEPVLADGREPAPSEPTERPAFAQALADFSGGMVMTPTLWAVGWLALLLVVVALGWAGRRRRKTRRASPSFA
ncbi:MAG TPA: hypothetical protein VD929_03485 [Caulobacteraceae bacterium]|nr:hypothetical protein [Caulobacteraceae bacterium]